VLSLQAENSKRQSSSHFDPTNKLNQSSSLTIKKPTATLSEASDDCNASREISEDANMINTERGLLISKVVEKK
jgi:hypothetical protein